MHVHTQTNNSVPNADDEDILVIACKLDVWRGAVRVRNGAIDCRTLRTSGETAIDELGCQALQTCFTEHRPALTEATNSAGRRQRVAEANRDLGACLVVRREQLIREFSQHH